MRCLRTTMALLGALCLVACSADDTGDRAAHPAAGRAPNILLILVDDMGYGDLGANRASGAAATLTPRLDAFAATGVRFTRHYVDSTCAATRAGIMTGTAPVARGFRPAGAGISPEVLTLPERLQALGYSTHHIGKWHLGYASTLALPTAQGFDDFYGFLSQFLLRGPHKPQKLRFARPTYSKPWLQHNEAAPVQVSGHLSDALLSRALDFLDSAGERAQPWFLNYWTFLPHKPLEPAPAFAARFPEDDDGRYRAMIAQLDDTVGRILDRLDERGLAESTLVLIASDNGGSRIALGSNLPFAGGKMSFQEGGVRTPLLMRWPGDLGAGTVRDEVVSYLDYLPTLVGAAGGRVPDPLPGRDLGRLLRGETLPERPLYWEAGSGEALSWSVLSADGRWRLHRFFGMAPMLNDLLTDPSGSTDVSDAHPAQLAALLADYQAWRLQQREVQVEFTGETSGHGQLSGEALQRAPGFGGFSFAIGLEPDEGVDSGEPQVIAEQDGLWRFRQADGELQLEVGELSLRAPAPPAGRCTAVIVSSLFSFDRILPNRGRAQLALFVDGVKVAEVQRRRPRLPPDNYGAPTFIGRDAGGGARYRGRLSAPVLLNEPLLAEADPWSGNGAAALGARLCPGG